MDNINGDLHKDPITKDKDLVAIREWLKKQPHLPNDLEDTWLLSFLRGCGFSLEKCKQKLDMYYTVRAACPEFFTNRDILRPEMLDMMTRAQNCTMPGLTPKGWRIHAARGLDHNLETEQIREVMKIAMMIADIRMREETEGVTGDVYILDAVSIHAHHLRGISPALLKKFFICAQEAYPLKLKEVHVVNASPLVDTIYAIVRPFLKDKIKKRIFFHKDYDSMHEYIPKYMLPKEYDGTGPSFDEINKHWLERLIKNRDWFKKQEAVKVNEALRPGKPRCYDEMLGIEGSFRQLVID